MTTNYFVGANIKKTYSKKHNIGFSTQHLLTLVPGIVDDALVYVEKLTEHAHKQDLFRLEEDTTRLTVDVIGKVVLDVRFNMQRGEDECINALREQVHYLPNETLNPFAMWHPYGMYKRWKNDRIMKRYIGKMLDERFASKEVVNEKNQRKRTIIDLALDSYISSGGDVEEKLDSSATNDLPQVMDAEFREGAITQIRSVIIFFLFSYKYTYMTSTYPSVVNHPLTFLPTESASSQATTRPHPPSATRTTSSKNTPNACNASAKNTKQFSVPSRKPPSASNKIPKFSTNSNTRSASSKKPSDSSPRLQRLAKAKKVSSSRIRKPERNLVQRVG